MGRPKKTPAIKSEERMTTVKITRKYFDITLNKNVESNLLHLCSQERAKQLINAKVAELVEIKK